MKRPSFRRSSEDANRLAPMQRRGRRLEKHRLGSNAWRGRNWQRRRARITRPFSTGFPSARCSVSTSARRAYPHTSFVDDARVAAPHCLERHHLHVQGHQRHVRQTLTGDGKKELPEPLVVGTQNRRQAYVTIPRMDDAIARIFGYPCPSRPRIAPNCSASAAWPEEWPETKTARCLGKGQPRVFTLVARACNTTFLHRTSTELFAIWVPLKMAV